MTTATEKVQTNTSRIQTLKEILAANLGNKGVPANGSETLAALIGKVANVTQTTPPYVYMLTKGTMVQYTTSPMSGYIAIPSPYYNNPSLVVTLLNNGFYTQDNLWSPNSRYTFTGYDASTSTWTQSTSVMINTRPGTSTNYYRAPASTYGPKFLNTSLLLITFPQWSYVKSDTNGLVIIVP